MASLRLIRPALALVIVLAGIGASLSAEPWTFAVFCDGRTAIGEKGGVNGVNAVVVNAIAHDVASHKVGMVLFAGDLVSGQLQYGPLARQFKSWKTAMAPVYEAGIPVYVCRGNHELGQDKPKGASVAAWREAFPDLPQNGPAEQKGLTYEVVHQNATFVAVDEFAGIQPGYNGKVYDSTINKGMIHPWVLEHVRNARTPWVFVFGHESAFNIHHLDCLSSFPEERDALWDALGSHGGMYLSGHDHRYVRHVAPDSQGHPVMELMVGCAGATPYPYDHREVNALHDRHVVPTDLFVNAVPGGVPNTHGLPMYFGYVLVTVDGTKLSGEWRAFTNYDTHTFTGPTPPELPRFEALDTFTWELPSR